jgi:hypothetical protein
VNESVHGDAVPGRRTVGELMQQPADIDGHRCRGAVRLGSDCPATRQKVVQKTKLLHRPETVVAEHESSRHEPAGRHPFQDDGVVSVQFQQTTKRQSHEPAATDRDAH